MTTQSYKNIKLDLGAPGTANPRHSAMPSGFQIPGAGPQIRQANQQDGTRQANHEAAGVNHSGQLHQAARRWATEEEKTLRLLCQKYEGRFIDWNAVVAAFCEKHQPRTKAALAKRWAMIRKDIANPPPCSNPETESGHNICADIDAHTGDDSSVATEQDSYRTQPDEKPSGVESRSEADWAHPEYTAPLDADGQDGEEYQAFRRTFYGYLRHAVTNFDRKPVKRIGKNCPQILLRYADIMVGEAVSGKKANQSEIGRLNAAVYAAARTVHQFWRGRSNPSRQKEEEWFSKMSEDQKHLKMLISDMTAELERRKEKRVPTASDRANIHRLVGEIGTRSTSGIARRREQYIQRLMLVTNRVSLREQERQRKLTRKRFADRPSIDVLLKKPSEETGARPSLESVMDYWKPIIGTRTPSTPDANPSLLEWKNEQQRTYPVSTEVSEAELRSGFRRALKRIRPWKASGPDGIHAFWWKKIPNAAKKLCSLVVDWLRSGKAKTGWLTRGRTLLIPKKGDLSRPENYRPITCLNTCYKLLTSVINEVVKRHLAKGDAIAANQRALRVGEWGCTHALLLDRAVVADATSQKRKALSVAWLDYKKAFDSIPHEYVRWVLEAVRLPTNILTTFMKLMNGWTTRFEWRLARTKKVATSGNMPILNGIFQGDAFSPNLFVLCVAPISYALNKGVKPYHSSAGKATGHSFELSHQFYMDDLKLYAGNPEDLRSQLNIVSRVSNAIGLHLNVGKCASAHYDPHQQWEGTIEERRGSDDKITVLGFNDSYKYLGVEQRLKITQGATEEYERKFMARAKTIFASELTWSQMVSAYKTLAVSIIRYVYMNAAGGEAKLESALKRARKLDTSIREVLKEEKCRFKGSCVSRLYIPGKLGGCNLASLEDALEDSIIATWCYLATQGDLQNQYRMFESLANRGKRTPVSDAIRILQKYGIDARVEVEQRKVEVGGTTYEHPTALHRYLRKRMLELRTEARVQRWKALAAAGRFLNNAHLDQSLSSLWLEKALISARNMRDVLAVQEGELVTKCCPKTRGRGDQQCRCCHSALETAEHITSSCRHWLPNLYVERHNAVARNIYYALCKKYQLTPVHYTQQIPPVRENDKCKILWDLEMQTKVPLKHRKPDIAVFDKEAPQWIIIEVAIAHASGLNQQRDLKINRYTVNSMELADDTDLPYPPGPNLLGDIMATYGTRVKFVPIVVGVCGEHLPVVKKDLELSLDLKGEEATNLIERLSRSAVLGTARIVRAHLAIHKNTG